jgi:hypothetical protein
MKLIMIAVMEDLVGKLIIYFGKDNEKKSSAGSGGGR